MYREKLRRFFDRHLHDIADRLFVVEDFERLRVVTFLAAVLTRHITAREKIHLQLDDALAFAGFATTALGVKGKPARGISAHARNRQLRIKIADLVEYFDVCAGRRARRLADGRLIDFVNGFDLTRAAHQLEQLSVTGPLLLF